MTLAPQCERQVGVRPTLTYNAVTIPRIVCCPHFAVPGTKFCKTHQTGATQ